MLGNVDSGVGSVESVTVQPAIDRAGVVPVDADTAAVGQARLTTVVDRRHTVLRDAEDGVTIVGRHPGRHTGRRRC